MSAVAECLLLLKKILETQTVLRMYTIPHHTPRTPTIIYSNFDALKYSKSEFQ